jgi:hypothetical protein
VHRGATLLLLAACIEVPGLESALRQFMLEAIVHLLAGVKRKAG